MAAGTETSLAVTVVKVLTEVKRKRMVRKKVKTWNKIYIYYFIVHSDTFWQLGKASWTVQPLQQSFAVSCDF